MSARLVDAAHVVVAASDDELIGEREASAAIDAALTDGSAYAGREQQDADGSEGGSMLEFVQPVRLGGRPFALEVDEDGSALEAQLGSVSTSLHWVFGLGLVVAFGLFYVFGGHALSRATAAAFVRHAHEIDELQDLSIEGGQGYLLGRPDVELLRGTVAPT